MNLNRSPDILFGHLSGKDARFTKEMWMFANLLVVTILIIVSWVAAAAYYLYTSRQHESLEQDIEALQALLDKSRQDAE